MIKFKDFNTWTYNHTADGRWSYHIALFCMRTCRTVNSLPFWKKKKIWKSINEIYDIRGLMNEVDKKIGIRKFVMK